MIKDIVQYRAQLNPNKIFIIDQNKKITYLDFNQQVSSIMQYINKICEHKYIGLQISNKIKLLQTIIALNRLNKIPIIYPPHINIRDYIIATKIKINLTDEHFNQVKYNKKDYSQNTKIIKYNKNVTQVILFTSGTTGIPKACELTYNNFKHNTKLWNNIINFSEEDIYLNHMPLYHVSGLCIFFRALYYNFTMVIEKYNLKNYNDLIHKKNITLTSMIPTMLREIIYKNKDNSLYGLKAIIIGGSNIDDKLVRLSIDNKLPLYISYGATETCSGIAGFWVNKCNNNKKYYPHSNVNIYVERSKLKIKSKSIMKGYLYGESAKNSFQSNDFVKINSDNSFRIIKNKKKIIISGGENISIEYIKKNIESHPEIESCSLKVIDDEKWGESLIASIKQKSNKLDSGNFKKELKKILPRHMIPKQIIFLNK